MNRLEVLRSALFVAAGQFVKIQAVTVDSASFDEIVANQKELDGDKTIPQTENTQRFDFQGPVGKVTVYRGTSAT